MKPFLILQLRENNEAADGEFQAFLTCGNLSKTNVVRIRMESDPLPEINLQDYAGIIVGGGPWNVSDHEEKQSDVQKNAEIWLHNLLNQIVKDDIPFLGACYGFGILTKNQGSLVSKEQYGEDVSGVDINLTEEGQRDPLLQGIPATFRALVGHKEACQKLPQNAILLGSSNTCPVQMFRIGQNVYATQFHPELDAEGICVRIDVYKHAGYFPPEDAEELKNRMRQEVITYPMHILKTFIERYQV